MMIIIKCNRSEFFVFMEPYSSGLDTGGLRVYPQPLLSPFLWGQRVVGSNPCSGSSSRICSQKHCLSDPSLGRGCGIMHMHTYTHAHEPACT